MFKRVATLVLWGALLGILVGSAVSQSVPAGCACTNNPPDSQYTCDQQVDFGKCDIDWMIEGKYCDFSCERCKCDEEDPTLEKEPAVTKPEADDADEDEDALEDAADADADALDAEEDAADADADEDDADEDEDDTDEEDEDADEDDATDPEDAAEVDDAETTVPVDPEKVPLMDLQDGGRRCKNTLFSALDQAEETSTLASLISSLGLEADLDEDTAEFTLFAPTNEAFVAFLKDQGTTVEELVSGGSEAATTVLQYHLAPKVFSKPALANAGEIDTLVKGSALFGGSGDEIDGLGSSAKIIGIPIPICKSNVYLVDTVLLPAASLVELTEEDEEVAEEPEEEEAVCDEVFNGFFGISEDKDLGILENLLNDLRLSGTLADPEEEYTMFAPTDAAFEELGNLLGKPVGTLATDDPDTLLGIMNYHILSKNMEAADLLEMGSGDLKTANKSEIILEVNGGRIELFGVGSTAEVIDGDIDKACLSAVHKVDAVLLPYKVGDNLAVRGSTAASNASATTTKTSEGTKGTGVCQVGDQSVFDVLSRQSDLKVFAQILRQANLQPILTNKELAVTVFAPVDFAFGNILPKGKGFFDLVPDVELAQDLISYHLGGSPVPKRLLKDGLKISTGLTSKNKPMSVEVAEDPQSFPLGLTLEAAASGANFTQLDVFACNSVIHKIDGVLLPAEDFLPSATVTVAEAVETAEDFDSLLASPKEPEDDETPATTTTTTRSG